MRQPLACNPTLPASAAACRAPHSPGGFPGWQHKGQRVPGQGTSPGRGQHQGGDSSKHQGPQMGQEQGGKGVLQSENITLIKPASGSGMVSVNGIHVGTELIPRGRKGRKIPAEEGTGVKFVVKGA